MILYYTDIQVDRYSRFDCKTNSGYGLRLDNIIECAEWIASEIIKRKPEVVVNGGDTYNSIGIVSSESLSATGRCISLIDKACEEVGADHIMILGNHDLSLLSNKVTTVDHLADLSTINLIKEPSSFSVGGYELGLIPYHHDKLYTKQALNHSMNSGHKIAFTHLDFNGMKFNSKMKSEGELLTTGYSKDFQIINGHYHIYQESGSVLCPGSSIQHKYTEFSEKRGILWIDKDLKLDFIQNEVSPWLVKVTTLKELRELDLPKSSYVYIDFNPIVDNEDEVYEELDTYARCIVNRSSSSISVKKFDQKLSGDTPEELIKNYIDEHYETSLDKAKLIQLCFKSIN